MIWFRLPDSDSTDLLELVVSDRREHDTTLRAQCFKGSTFALSEESCYLAQAGALVSSVESDIQIIIIREWIVHE